MPDSTIEIRTENPSGTGVENYLLYSGNGIEEEPMDAITDGPLTISGTAPGPVTSDLRYGFRLIQGDELDFLPVKLFTGVTPDPEDLTRVAEDPVGDELFGYSNLDLVDCHVSYSDDKFFCALTNAGGGFPVIQGLTFFGYLLGIADPAEVDPDTVFGMMYTFEQAGIISPGLYRIEGTAMSDLIKIGEVSVQEYPATNQLMISCELADLEADPYFQSWYDPSDPVIGVAAFTQRITLLGGASEADRSDGGRCYLREVSVTSGTNQLPQISNLVFEGSGSGAYAQIEYLDGDENCPVVSEIVFDGTTTLRMYPQTLDYGSAVVYRTDLGMPPLSDKSWTSAVVSFSDNLSDTVECETINVGVEKETPLLLTATRLISIAPNPFSSTTRIDFEMAGAARIQLEVFDASGRQVRRIIDARKAAGNHSAIWDGKDNTGAQLNSGVYFCRISCGDTEASGKILLLQ
jgi:hypothetical protein